jgi:NAD+ synthase (glutamine-hydrolysing)
MSYGPSCYLWDYLRKSGASGYFLPLSGGADSASSALIVYNMCEIAYKALKEGDMDILETIRKIVGDKNYIPVDSKDIC